ncbi:FG-GAP-like repeat-containing protein [Rubripirellula sp.]|jgi:predicted Zn-dependent protease|nr:FG-GAP-like repeat-containing protein [Rubripirellula sp.]
MSVKPASSVKDFSPSFWISWSGRKAKGKRVDLSPACKQINEQQMKPQISTRGSGLTCQFRARAWYHRNRSWCVYLCILLTATGCNSESKLSDTEPTKTATPVERLLVAMQNEDWELANQCAQEALIISPKDPDLLTYAAKTAAYCNRKREAAQLLVDAATHANYQPTARVTFAVQALIDVGDLYPAINLLEASLKQNPEAHDQRRSLVGFLCEAQRMDLLPEHLMKLYRARQFDVRLLLAVTETSSRRLSPKTSERLMQRNPDDHRVRLAEAFVMMYRHDSESGAEILEDVLEHHPKFAPAHAMYGQALMAENRLVDIPNWLKTATPQSAQYADYWLTIGDLATQRAQVREAVRAYWEATRRDSGSNTAWDRLGQAMLQLQASEDSLISSEQVNAVLARSTEMLDLRERFNHFAADGQTNQAKALDVAVSLLRLGRVWEAEAWSAAATTLPDGPSTDLPAIRKRILAKLSVDQSWVSADAPACSLDFSNLPISVASNPSSTASTGNAIIPKLAGTEHLRLEEQSIAWGLRDIASNNNPTDARLAAIIRSTGVGGGAIDYDLDGLPDIMVMGAGGTMQQRDSQANQLLRNLGSSFKEISKIAGVADPGFGQGLAIGDFNEDGFPDLFFANLGQNRLLRNNGDGSFTDCTELLMENDSKSWSTSAVFVDLNQNGIADLVVTNYCQTVSGLDMGCPNQEGVIGPCHPLTFPADADRFYEGVGNGSFRNTTSQWVSEPSTGRGLGILAGNLDGTQLGVFIANDMSRNAFYTPTKTANGTELEENASVRGVAVDGRTQAQASMGIASSDFDLDGDLDLYVTGFGREYNIYYEQIAPGIWRDETNKLDLAQPTLSVVGFGTEAIDLDNDGIDEIAVTNGHIGDFSDAESLPYEQPIQLFRRRQDGRFELLSDDDWGKYFRDHHVGRGLWTMDVNRDGKTDLVLTHTKEQLRLLVNRTENAGKSIGFQIKGTTCSRDAIGSTIQFTYKDQPRTLWLLAGDGYMCANEKILRAGLGDATQVENVSITWPDGKTEQVGTLETGTDYLLVQGKAAFNLKD